MINTRFWNDNFVVALKPMDRYLFLYFLTNEHTNIAGIYELPMRSIIFETGISKAQIQSMIKHLEGKVYYIDGWVYIPNFQRHQSTSSSTVKRGIEIEMAKIPTTIIEKIRSIGGIDTLSGAIIYPNLNLNINPNLNPNAKIQPPSFMEGKTKTELQTMKDSLTLKMRYKN